MRNEKNQARNFPMLLTVIEIAIVLAAAVSVFRCVRLLLELQPASAIADVPAELAIMDRFDACINNLKSDALDGILNVGKNYWIRDDVKIAPKPNPEFYGSLSSSDQVGELTERASEVLQGQSLYLTENTKLLEGSEILHYLDESIFAAAWKEVHDDCVYTFAEVKILHPSQFRRYLGEGYGSDKQFTTTEMAENVQAVLASSGDFYRFRNYGAIVYEGIPRRLISRGSETCYINESGDLLFSHAGEIETMEQLKAFVEENNIRFSLAFGPILVDNGVLCRPGWYEIGEIDGRYARAALCQMDKLHYMVVMANAEGDYRIYPTIRTFAEHVAATGCRMAYTLDGGQTATIAMDTKMVNQVSYGSQRKISDIIYFATAVPDGG